MTELRRNRYKKAKHHLLGSFSAILSICSHGVQGAPSLNFELKYDVGAMHELLFLTQSFKLNRALHFA